jgi:hypothetical protein
VKPNPRKPNRVVVELSDETMAMLRELADVDGITKSECIRRSLWAGRFFVSARIGDERVLLQNRKTGSVREVVIW